MIQNPHVKGGFYRYDPAEQTLTREGFAHNEMHEVRRGVRRWRGKTPGPNPIHLVNWCL